MVISADYCFWLVTLVENLGILDQKIFGIAIFSKGGNAAGLAFGFALIIIRRYEFNLVPLPLGWRLVVANIVYGRDMRKKQVR